MRIGFDMDGVICKFDEGFYRLVQMLDYDDAVRKEIMRYHYRTVEPKIDVRQFVGDGDEVFIITGRNKEYEDVTREWLKRHGYEYPVVFLSNNDLRSCDDVGLFYNDLAMKKVKMVETLGLDVYFEDNSFIVKVMRNYCTNTKVITVV